MSRIRSNIAGLYDLGDTLGRGHFAVVKLAKHVFTGEQVAVKVIDKTKLDDVSRAHLFQEVRCMKLVQHPNVVRLYEVIDTQTKLYLILELGDGGDMYDYIMKHEKGVDEETAKKYFRQIVQAISYCHKLHVVHRDLKPENVVFFEKLGMVKLTDFGFSNKFCPGQKLETSCGSLAYSAPEILLGDSYDAPKVDVWSLGVILYMMVCGHAPFQEANDSETLTMIMDCKYTVPSYISPSCHYLIQRMLIRNPETRATLEDISNDMWLNSGDTIQPAECLPLISRESLLEEDHAHIIQKMVNGNIASKEDITEALDKNEYNHITATYYLLAERKLRAQRHEKAQMMHSRISRADLSPIAVTPGISSATPSPAQEKPTSADSLLSPCVTLKTLETKHYGVQLVPPAPTITTTPTTTETVPSPAANATPPNTLDIPNACLPLGRKCSIVREEEDSLTSANSSPTKSPLQETATDAKIPRKPLPTAAVMGDCVVKTSDIQLAIPNFRANCHVRPVMSLPIAAASTNVKGKGEKSKGTATQKAKSLPSPGRRLHTVQSSPQLLLNEIDEETEHESDSAGYRPHGGHKKPCYLGKIHSHNSAVSHAMLRIMGQRHKFTKNRTASCSSSDASDDDGESLKRIMKLKTPGRRDRDRKDRGGNKGGGSGGGGNCNGNGDSHRPGGSGSEPNDHQDGGNQFGKNTSTCSGSNRDEIECLKSTHLGSIVFPTDSTDSLDLISENQPRLTTSVSCGDLTSEALPALEGSSLSAENLHENTAVVPPPAKILEKEMMPEMMAPDTSSLTAKLRNKLSNSLSLSSGLSCLQNTTHVSSDSLAQKKESTRLNIGKLVQKSPIKQRLDINQNGWKKGGANQRSAMEMKMASKCCTLC